MKILATIATAIVAAITSTSATARFVSPDLEGAASLRPIYIEITDQSEDDCFSNSDQVKAYARDLLAEKNYQVTNLVFHRGYNLSVTVIAHRVNGLCAGAIYTQLWNGNVRKDIYGVHEIASGFVIATHSESIGTAVLEALQAFIAQLPEN
ncbi:hypothetical protein [Tropicibacter sp. Alg240-R139]|uniref:hypothetical protein n=1 Tax=Tropicibacter sp. Alg240-R139 TaxID=2305991 RepID=UPI0013DF27A1|nr:hypothetical protein [Tropicibacter sp. Alg240-R139]